MLRKSTGRHNSAPWPHAVVRAGVVALAALATAAVVTPSAAGAASATSEKVVRTAPISFAAREIVNPLRGEYQWLSSPPDPASWPTIDSYVRYSWRDLEPSPGHFDFRQIDRALANAATRGGRFAFRVMAFCPGCDMSGGRLVPDGIPGFWYKDKSEAGEREFMPAWNSASFITRWTALMQALGHRYRDDPRLGYLDVGGYGSWGEWHLYLEPGPAITNAHAKQVIDAVNAAFPRKPLVMMTATPWALQYALGLSPRIGVRVDCLGGSSTMYGATDYMNQAKKLGPNDPFARWRTAPFVTEWCAATSAKSEFDLGDRQVAKYHISALSSGNYSPPYAKMSAADKALFAHANKSAGYRDLPVRMTLPASLTGGVPFAVSTNWANDGNAPAYDSWDVRFELRTLHGDRVVWSANSSLDLRTLLPTGASGKKVTDRYVLPTSLPAGRYQLRLRVVDPGGYLSPLALAIRGRAADGSYPLTTVAVARD